MFVFFLLVLFKKLFCQNYMYIIYLLSGGLAPMGNPLMDISSTRKTEQPQENYTDISKCRSDVVRVQKAQDQKLALYMGLMVFNRFQHKNGLELSIYDRMRIFPSFYDDEMEVGIRKGQPLPTQNKLYDFCFGFMWPADAHDIN